MASERVKTAPGELADFCRRHHITKLSFFGSVLRDDFAPESDVDVLVEFAPGHTPGHVMFYCAEEGVLFSGDVLFQGGIGRTDLPGGNHRTLLHSIRTQVLSLPDSTRVYSGHGPPTTVGRERERNPFL
jgi:glyoxylase-like metal-dependent hydrolase (beta-lactamase superfamily II)